MSEPPAEIRSWADVEAALSKLPRRAIVLFAARCARRLLPNVARLSKAFGPDAGEWTHATAETVRVAEAFGRGEAVSRFTLDLAAEVARCAASATANAARILGGSPLMEPAELAYAAAAFAADAARATGTERAVGCAVRSAQMEADGGEPIAGQLGDLLAMVRDEPLPPLPPSPAPAGSLRLLRDGG